MINWKEIGIALSWLNPCFIRELFWKEFVKPRKTQPG
jgi:hypothetical protein